eukprot:scaffold10498_cov179-Ochromonas_danica.AAC.2
MGRSGQVKAIVLLRGILVSQIGDWHMYSALPNRSSMQSVLSSIFSIFSSRGSSTSKTENKPLPSSSSVGGNQKKKLDLSALSTTSFDPSICTVTPLPLNIRTWQGDGREQFAIVINNLLSVEECQQWILETEAHGYDPALLNVGNDQEILRRDVRHSMRCAGESEERVNELWTRVKLFLPPTASYSASGWYQGQQPVRLNELMRFLRYDPGHYFVPHCDGYYQYPAGHDHSGERSLLTILIYLNEDFEGGCTRFYASRPPQKDYENDHDDQNNNDDDDDDENSDGHFDFHPRVGSVVIFEHNIFHSAEKLTKGRKYSLRTDIMFEANSLPA